jgi:hypothetical protein
VTSANCCCEASDDHHGGAGGRNRSPALRRALARGDDRQPARRASGRRPAGARDRRGARPRWRLAPAPVRPLARLHSRDAGALPAAASDPALRHAARARLQGSDAHAARVRRTDSAGAPPRGVPAHRAARRRAGADRLGLRGQAGGAGRRATCGSS